jgi:hypothetical protein
VTSIHPSPQEGDAIPYHRAAEAGRAAGGPGPGKEVRTPSAPSTTPLPHTPNRGSSAAEMKRSPGRNLEPTTDLVVEATRQRPRSSPSLSSLRIYLVRYVPLLEAVVNRSFALVTEKTVTTSSLLVKKRCLLTAN